MGKKVQMCIWVIVLLLVTVLLGGVIYSFTKAKFNGNNHPEVTFELENYGTVKMELYPEYAPNTVSNIIKLVEKGYYTNKVIYGKDPMCLYVGRNSEGEIDNPTTSLIFDEIEKGSEYDYEYSIKGEFIVNGYNDNTLSHEKGIVSMIRNNYGSNLASESYNSGNSQIGIMMSDDASGLNGVYAAFGRVTEGMDILEKIYTENEVNPNKDEEGNVIDDEGAIKAFTTFPVIKSATVDKHGVEYENPVVQESFDYESYVYELMQSYYGN